MKFSKKSILSTSLAVTLAAATVIGGGSYAYLHDKTEDVINTFKTNQVMVDLKETTGSDYNIIPGTEQEKDPTVKVSTTVPAYAFVEVSNNTKGLVNYEIADGWYQLDGYEDTQPEVYYREIAADTETQEFAVLEGNKVSYGADLENEDMYLIGTLLDPTIKLSFKAKAIQKDGFADAVAAYEALPVAVSNGTELKDAMGSVKEGQTIKLESDVTLITSGKHPSGTVASYITIPNVTIDLNAFTLKTSTSGDGKSFGLAASGITLKNGTVELTNKKNDYPLYVTNGAKDVVIDNVKIIGGIQVIGNSTATLRNVDIQAHNFYDVYLEYKSTATIESGTFRRSGTMPHIYTAQATDKVIVKGGDFDGSAVPEYKGNGTVEIVG